MSEMRAPNKSMSNIKVILPSGLVIVNDRRFPTPHDLRINLFFTQIGFEVVLTIVLIICFCNSFGFKTTKKNTEGE
jgi:hypothetical protein